jgi:hypothetical protein
MLDENVPPLDAPRSEKPLCLGQMASMVFSVVKNSECMTFETVADTVLARALDEPTESKDVRNLRRRVYDVLNVFLAARLVVKEGKFIVWRPQPLPPLWSPAVASLMDRTRIKQMQMVDKARLFVSWTLLIAHKRNRVKPPVTFPVWRVIFVGFTDSRQGVFKHGVDRKRIEIEAGSVPVFFSVPEMIAKIGFTEGQTLEVLQTTPGFEAALPYFSPIDPFRDQTREGGRLSVSTQKVP